jgi:spermidine dehydrogenase
MACFNAIVPYLCPELPDAQKQALHRMVRKPLTATAVGLNNWRAFATAKTRSIAFPNGFYSHLFLDLGYDLGAYRGAKSPEDPAIVLLGYTPNFPGAPAREQYREGRARMMEYSLEFYERNAREQLMRALGPSGFDDRRDIAGITVNRWAHGYACGENDLYDPERITVAESSWVVGRKRFGRIAIANSDSAGVSMAQAAFDQANRAVKDLIYEVLEPTFYFSNPARG